MGCLHKSSVAGTPERGLAGSGGAHISNMAVSKEMGLGFGASLLQSPGLLGACDMPALFLLICDVLDLPWPPMHCAFPVSPVGTAGGSPSVPMLHFRGEGADVEKGSMVPGHPLKAGLGLEPLFLGLPAHVHI